MPQPKLGSPGVGDHVADAEGVERIVTDIRWGRLILRPLRGMYREISVLPSEVSPVPQSPSGPSELQVVGGRRP